MVKIDIKRINAKGSIRGLPLALRLFAAVFVCFDFYKLDLGHKRLMGLFKWELMLTRDKTPEVRGMLTSTARGFYQKGEYKRAVKPARGLLQRQ